MFPFEPLERFSLTYKGFDLGTLFTVSEITGRGVVGKDIETSYTSGVPGAKVDEVVEGPRNIEVTAVVEAENEEAMRKKLETINSYLQSTKPEETVFQDEPDRVYYSIPGSVSEAYEVKGLYKFTITFFCPKRFKYGYKTILESEDGSFFVVNKGTRECKPFLRVEVLQQITYIDLFKEDAYMRLGSPQELGQQVVERYERVLSDPLNSQIGWTSSGTAVDGGDVAGGFTINNGAFAVSSYGTGSNWHGPASKRAIPSSPLQDFRAEFRIKLPTISGGYGRAEMYIKDDVGNTVVKVAMKKVGGGSSGNRAEVILVNGSDRHVLVSYDSATGRAWNNFAGLLQVERIGNVWRAYIAMVDQRTSEHHTRYRPQPFIDTEFRYSQTVSQVQLHIGQSGTLPVPDIEIYNLTIDKINEIPDTDPFVIANPGDVIEIDFERAKCMINGEEVNGLKDFGADYFGIPPGNHRLFYEPAADVKATLSYREVFT